MSLNLFKKLKSYALSEEFIRRFDKRPFSARAESDGERKERDKTEIKNDSDRADRRAK